MRTARDRHTRGFTLIETALALLAISLGLLGIFGLARHGLKASGDAELETRCALLADTVFATLRAKNAELAAQDASLDDWWLYWLRFASGSADAALYLPPLSEVSENGGPVRVALGSHALNQFLPAETALAEIKWNPVYNLTLNLNGIDTGNLAEMRDAYERGQIDVALDIHPGALLSGGDVRSYSSVLLYAGGLP